MFNIKTSTEIVTKPRTKQTARMSTGGIAPRKQVRVSEKLVRMMKRVTISPVLGIIAMLFKS